MNEKIYLMEMQHRTDEHETDRMIAYLKKLGFSYLTMDLEGFRSGSMDEKITQKEETK